MVCNASFAQSAVLSASYLDYPLVLLHYCATDIINKYDSYDGLQASHGAQHGVQCNAVQSLVAAKLPEAKQSRYERELTPPPFNTLFLVSIGNHIV